MTQTAFADAIGVRQATVSRYVDGRFRPAPEVMTRIREATAGAVTAEDFGEMGRGFDNRSAGKRR